MVNHLRPFGYIGGFFCCAGATPRTPVLLGYGTGTHRREGTTDHPRGSRGGGELESGLTPWGLAIGSDGDTGSGRSHADGGPFQAGSESSNGGIGARLPGGVRCLWVRWWASRRNDPTCGRSLTARQRGWIQKRVGSGLLLERHALQGIQTTRGGR